MSAKAVWLIKSSGHILGPFEYEKVIELLRSKEIVVLDEVSMPCQRWNYIRDQIEFQDIVEEIRQGRLRDEGLEGTQTVSAGTFTSTPSLGITESIDIINDDLTEEINVGEIVYDDVKEYVPRVKKKQSNPIESYAFHGDKNLKSQASRSAKLLWAITAAILIITGGLVIYKSVFNKPVENKELAIKKLNSGIMKTELGDYNEALADFKESHSLDKRNTDVFLYLGTLLIQLEEQTLQGKRLLEDELNRKTPFKKQALTGVGLATLIEGDLDGATNKFEQALDIDPIYLPARINIGAAALEAKLYQEANNHLHVAVKEGAVDGAAVLMLTESFIRLWEEKGDLTFLSEASSLLEQYLAKNKDYYQETLILSAYVDMVNGKRSRAIDKIYASIDIDPELTSDHKHNIYIYRRRAGWQLLEPWCDRLVEAVEPQPQVKAFHALCLVKSGQKVRASQRIDDAISQSPKDPLLQATYGYILKQIGLEDQAAMAYGRSVEFDLRRRFKLPLIMQARFCEEKGDTECALLYWQQLLQKDAKSLPALAGVGFAHLRNNSYADARKFMRRGMRISSNYKPLLKLKSELENTPNIDKGDPRGL
jgi:tetratricopeptide (TPR) repeat protein